MQARRDGRWWKERWVADHYAAIKSPKLLEGQMEHRGFTCARLADAAAYERIRNGSHKGVSRQMISLLKNGGIKTCEPDLAEAIERVLDVPPHMLFDVLPKARDTRQTVKGQAA